MFTYVIYGNVLLNFFVVLGPIVLSCIIIENKSGMIPNVIYLFMVGVLIIKKLREDTQKIVEIINLYIKGVMIPIERKPYLLKDNEKNFNIEWDRKKTLIVLVVLLTVFLGSLINNYFKDNIVLKGVVFILAIGVMIKDSHIGMQKPKQTNEGSIKMDFYLQSFQTEVEAMCEK